MSDKLCVSLQALFYLGGLLRFAFTGHSPLTAGH